MSAFDAVVIGGGPAGMTAAMYLARSELTVALAERLAPGGQVLMTHMIENYPGFPEGIEGWQLADVFSKHLDSYSITRLGDEVRALEPGRAVHRIQVGSQWVQARAVVICSGARYKRLGIPGEEPFLGRGVSYCALCDGNFFKGQTVAVIGGGNSALEESLYLARLVKKLYLIHRRADFRGQKCFQNRCEINPVINILRSSVVEEISGGSEVEAVTVKNIETGETRRLDVSGVFIFAGFEPQGEFIPQSLVRDDQGFLVTDQDCRTNIPGIYAAGDIRAKTVRQVATAVGDGAQAAGAAISYLETLGSHPS